MHTDHVRRKICGDGVDLLLDLGRGPEQMVVLGGVELLPRKNIHRIRKLLVEIFVQHIAGLIFQDVFIIKALTGSELQKQLLRVVQGVDVDELKFVCGEEQFLKGTVQFRRVQPEHF